MKHQLTAITLTGTLLTSFALAPLSAVMAKQTNQLPTTMILAAKPDGELLKNIPFSQTVTNATYTAVEGRITITEFTYQNGRLLANGVIAGTATHSNGSTSDFNKTFSGIPATLTRSGNKAANKAVCDILFLDLGPIFLDVLGLTVDLSPITLDINAVSGPGNLLGNLLCALVGLLDAGGPLSGILSLIDQINSLLG
ncbi:MAG: hypothetical protein LDL41_15225 [Coleofasciculus sp. S288]|nr:hypothetical protein [Coleofasciculus sp. S288]